MIIIIHCAYYVPETIYIVLYMHKMIYYPCQPCDVSEVSPVISPLTDEEIGVQKTT